MVTSRYCSLLGGYWWILLVTARNCSFPLLVWMPWNSTITDKWKKNLVLLNKMGVIVWKESKTKVSERFLLINDTFVTLVHICFRVPLYKIMSSGNVLWSKPTSKKCLFRLDHSPWCLLQKYFSRCDMPLRYNMKYATYQLYTFSAHGIVIILSVLSKDFLLLYGSIFNSLGHKGEPAYGLLLSVFNCFKIIRNHFVI